MKAPQAICTWKLKKSDHDGHLPRKMSRKEQHLRRIESSLLATFQPAPPLDLRADSSVSAKALNVDHSRHRAGATGQGPHERKPSLTKNWAEFAEPQVPSNLHLLHKFRNHKNNQKVDESLVRKSTSRILTKPTKNVVHGNNLSSYFHKSVASVSQTFFWGIIL